MQRALAAIAAIVLVVACARLPRVEPSETQAIADDARSLLSVHPTRAAVDPAFWPESVKALRPKEVRSGDDGLFVETWSRGAEETGVFVPRDPLTFAPRPGGDPEFTLVANAVYVYRIRG